MLSTVFRHVRLLLVTGLLCVPPSLAVAQEPSPQAPASSARRPAVLFTGGFEMGCNHLLAAKLKEDGFNVSYTGQPGLAGEPLTWDRIKPYNVLVITGLDPSNPDKTLTEKNKSNIALLQRFMEEGGGIFYVPSYVEIDTQIPPQIAFLKPLGVTPLFDEVVYDPDTHVIATVWKLPFAYTPNIARPSPISQDVTGLWYPQATHAGAQAHTTALAIDHQWTAWVRGAKTAGTFAVPHTAWPVVTDDAPAGTYSREPVLMAARNVGKGRIVCFSISSKYLFEECALHALDGVVFHRGLRGQPSQGYELLRNALRWLAEPSLTSGQLGGAKMDERLLVDPFQTKFRKPFDWNANVVPPTDPTQLPGVIGARTAYSTGTGTVAEWVAAARQQGLGFLVFLEDFAAMTPAKLEALKHDCAAATHADFTAVPGFTIDDEIGNHYFYCSDTLAWPDPACLTADGKRFGNPDPRDKGQLAEGTLHYVHTQSGMRLIAGNYLYQQNAAPFVNWFCNWSAAAVITCRDGRQVEDITAGYLALSKAGQGPHPFALNLITDPARIASSPWRTVLTPATPDRLDAQPTPVAAYLSSWHFYPDNPTSIYITDGPRIDNWSFAGPRDYEGANHGDFVWQNFRWRVYGKVSSDAGLKEVVIHDGPRVFRRFLPHGQKQFEFTLDLTHDRQHTLVMIVTDLNGRRAISGDQWDRNHRLEEFQCGDRNNQLTYGYNTAADGDGLLLGGNQPLATPNKRIDNKAISPSGTFKNDPVIGAAAFDGAAYGEPEVFVPIMLRIPGQPDLFAPNACESFRLLHTGDVNIGESRWENRFTDNIQVKNVWHTLWRATPADDFTVTARYHFFQPDPDSPLAVFFWRFDIHLKKNLPNTGLNVGFIDTRDATLWAMRSSDDTCYAGQWEQTPESARRDLTIPLGTTGYIAALDAPLGGAAIFALTPDMQATLNLPAGKRLSFGFPPEKSPQNAGQTQRIELLLLGIPRTMPRTARLPGASTEVVERFRADFGLGHAPPAYQLDVATGQVLSQRYFLKIDGGTQHAFSAKLAGKLISALPILVSGLNDNWSALLYDRTLQQARPLGVLENTAYATLVIQPHTDLFIGHPVICDNPDIVLQVTQTAPDQWDTEIHNPTGTAAQVVVWPNPFFDPLRTRPAQTVDVPAGASVHVSWRKP